MVIMVMLVVASPATYTQAKKHHHLTDTQKEDSVATDSHGRPCNLGPAHDQCRDYNAAKGSEDLNDDVL